MKTQTSNLAFKTVSVIELDQKSLQNINGGSSPMCLPSSIIVITTLRKE